MDKDMLRDKKAVREIVNFCKLNPDCGIYTYFYDPDEDEVIEFDYADVDYANSDELQLYVVASEEELKINEFFKSFSADPNKLRTIKEPEWLNKSCI